MRPPPLNVPLQVGMVPKIIHQIWLGANPMPDEWIDTIKDFAKRFGYEYKLWTEDNIKGLDMKSIPEVYSLYNKPGFEMAGKADIIRLFALYKYGGIYIDADSVIMKPAKLNSFLQKNKAPVFFGWEELSRSRSRKLKVRAPDGSYIKRLIANGFIGSVPGHPFIKLLLEVLADKKKDEKAAWKLTGPLFVTKVYMDHKEEFPDIHIYPMKYFYPIHWGGIKDPEMHKKIKIPSQSMLFQYGYSTNGFAEIFKRRQTRKL